MSIITLTTDFGEKDYYVGALKGKILSYNANTNIIDISHQIESYNIKHAALVLANSFMHFPAKTVHLIGVLSMYQKDSKYLAIRHSNHFFVGPDNGIFHLIVKPPFNETYKIKVPENVESSFPELDYFAEVAAKLSAGHTLESIGEKISGPTERMRLRPTYNDKGINASVLHIDNYSNVILNVDKELFENVAKGRKFTVSFNRNDFIEGLQKNYSAVPLVEKCCFFNSAGLLQISLNQGKASELLGLKKDSIVLINFDDY